MSYIPHPHTSQQGHVYLSVGWPADHPVSVHGYGHDGQGGHEDSQAGGALQQSGK